MTITSIRSWTNIDPEGIPRVWLGTILFLIPMAMAGCAQMEAPPGGPVDLTPPAVMQHHPLAGATGVSPSEPIVVTFSERMDQASVADHLFISPRPSEEPDLRWKGVHLEVQLASGLSAEQTYVLTLGVGCKDIRNNEMSSSYSFAFSTGQAVDQGTILGQVYQESTPRKGVALWAYRLKDGQDPDPQSDPADYITQTDDRGDFHLNHLGRGRYRVFAIDDGNNDHRLQVAEEPVGVPASDPILNGERLESHLQPLRLALLDTAGPSLKGVEVSHRHEVVLTFDQPLDSLLAVDPHSYRIVTSQGAADSVDIRAICLLPDRPDQVILSTAEQQKDRIYQVMAIGVKDRFGHSAAVAGGWDEFPGTDRPDTVGPRLEALWPPDSTQAVLPERELWVWFDEAVEKASLEQAMTLVDTTGQKMSGQFRWWHGAAVSFVPDPALAPGSWYVLSLDGTRVRDLAGNVMGDSVLSSSFATAAADLPGAHSGTIQRGSYPLQARAVIRVMGPGSEPGISEVNSIGGEYYFPALLPGPYLLSGFLDLDGDGRCGLGHPHPFVPAEPWWISPDSVLVRSRWETAGVEVFFDLR